MDANLEAFPNHKWADPDPKGLVHLLKHLKEHPDEARGKGKEARRCIVDSWSNLALSKIVASHLERLSREKGDSSAKSEL